MPTIMFVEDDLQIRNAYSYVLTRHGFQVLEAGTAEEALELLYHHKPDVMVLDMLMPGLSGLELLRQHDMRKEFPSMKIIGFSNVDNPKIIAEANSLGVDDYIVKVNITPSQMVDRLSQLTGHRPANLN